MLVRELIDARGRLLVALAAYAANEEEEARVPCVAVRGVIASPAARRVSA